VELGKILQLVAERKAAGEGKHQERVEVEQGDRGAPLPMNPAPAVEDILAAAQQQVEALLTFAQQEAERIREEAHTQGLLSGREEGKEQAKQELLSSLVTFAQAGQSLIVLEEQLIERFTPQLVRFALEIAEKVTGKQVEEDPLIVATVLERARAELPQARSVRIWVHPQDHQVLAELRPDLVWTGEKGGRTVEVLSSEEVERGGCRIETEMGLVDATIPVQMQEIRRQMLE
jgi:flagellar biosynthesis/type III secretory pathway protein FliH